MSYISCARARRAVTFALRAQKRLERSSITRRTVVDEYGAGPPEVARDSVRGVLCRGGKRDFSPYLNRGLDESHSTQYEYAVRSTLCVRSTRYTLYARKVCGPYLVDTKPSQF